MDRLDGWQIAGLALVLLVGLGAVLGAVGAAWYLAITN